MWVENREENLIRASSPEGTENQECLDSPCMMREAGEGVEGETIPRTEGDGASITDEPIMDTKHVDDVSNDDNGNESAQAKTSVSSALDGDVVEENPTAIANEVDEVTNEADKASREEVASSNDGDATSLPSPDTVSVSTSIMKVPSQESLTEARSGLSQVLLKDAFLVFRTLCKLSMKPVADTADPR